MLLPLGTTLILGALTGITSADGIYTKNSPVLQVNAQTYDSVIARSNHTSILEFYAPWCGHCQNLKPAYEKAASNLAGLAKVAAINCDEESNKPFCGQMGVQGFPTLKIIRPGPKPGRPAVEDYQGARTAKGIVDAVVDKIPNHVKKIQDEGLEEWLKDTSTAAKAILFSDKGTTGPLIKSLAIDFLGSIGFAQIRNKEKEAVHKFGIKKFPTIVLVAGPDKESVVYDGEMNKEGMTAFFSEVASPNPDPAPKKAKASTKKAKSATSSSTVSSAFSKASEAHRSSDFEDFIQGSGTILLGDDTPTESPLPIVEHEEKPMIIEDVVPEIPQLSHIAELHASCMSAKSGNCVLILLPAGAESTLSTLASQALASFAEVAEKHRKRHAKIFPFYSVPATNQGATILRDLLELKSDTLEVFAMNAKRKWWRQFTAATYELSEVENFVDAIKLGEGSKKKLPEGLFAQKVDEQASSVTAMPEAEPTPEPVAEGVTSSVAEPEPAAAPSPHDEL